MTRHGTTITAAHEMTCAKMTLDPSMTARHVHHRGVEIIVTTNAFHYGRVQSHAKKEAAFIVATTTVRAIRTTIAAIEDQKSDSNDHRLTATAVTSAKPHSVNKFCGASPSLDKA